MVYIDITCSTASYIVIYRRRFPFPEPSSPSSPPPFSPGRGGRRVILSLSSRDSSLSLLFRPKPRPAPIVRPYGVPAFSLPRFLRSHLHLLPSWASQYLARSERRQQFKMRGEGELKEGQTATSVSFRGTSKTIASPPSSPFAHSTGRSVLQGIGDLIDDHIRTCHIYILACCCQLTAS